MSHSSVGVQGDANINPPPELRTSALALRKAPRRRWLLAVTLGCLAAVVAATAVWLFLPPGKHTAYAKFFMPKNVSGLCQT